MESQYLRSLVCCKKCNCLLAYEDNIETEDAIEDLTRDQLIKLINFGNNRSCNNCGSQSFQTLTITTEFEFIYDFRKSPIEGIINIHSSKGEVDENKVTSNNSAFTSIDLINAVLVIRENIEVLISEMEERVKIAFEGSLKNVKEEGFSFDGSGMGGVNRLESCTEGRFSFSAKFINVPPYVIPYGGTSQGYSYMEIRNILREIELGAKQVAEKEFGFKGAII